MCVCIKLLLLSITVQWTNVYFRCHMFIFYPRHFAVMLMVWYITKFFPMNFLFFDFLVYFVYHGKINMLWTFITLIPKYSAWKERATICQTKPGPDLWCDELSDETWPSDRVTTLCSLRNGLLEQTGTEC